MLYDYFAVDKPSFDKILLKISDAVNNPTNNNIAAFNES